MRTSYPDLKAIMVQQSGTNCEIVKNYGALTKVLLKT
jgi:hypothetical protein